MAHNKRHIIVYHPDNQDLATNIKSDLEGAGFTIGLHNVVAQPAADLPLSLVPSVDGSVLLLVTDNYLKSENGMKGALQSMRAWADNGQLVPIVADGVALNSDGSRTPVPTSFERVSNIIQYMNFWQDRYLELRKEKRTHESPALEQQIENTKRARFRRDRRVPALPAQPPLVFARRIRFGQLPRLQIAPRRGRTEHRHPGLGSAGLGTAAPTSPRRKGEVPCRDHPRFGRRAHRREPRAQPAQGPAQAETKKEDNGQVNLVDIPGIDLLMEREAQQENEYHLAEEDDSNT